MKEIGMMPILTLITQIKLQNIMRDWRSIMNCLSKIEKKYLRSMESLKRVRLKSKEKKENNKDLKRTLKDSLKGSNVRDKSNKKKEKLDKPN